jgi:DNA-binding GntR family transcriptional regulator
VKQVDRPPTLVAAAADNIRHEILRGELLPGQSLPEVELSKTLNISLGSVREALRLLQQDCLVEVIPYRGAFVARLSTERVEEIYTLRCLLEPYAVRLSIENQLNTKLYRSDMVPDDVSHQALCDGIMSGDAALAAELVRKHISDAGSSLVRRMQEAERVAESLPG